MFFVIIWIILALVRAKSVSWCSRCRIHRFVAAHAVLGMYPICYLPVLLEWRSGCLAPWWSTVWVGGWTPPTASGAAGSAPPTAACCSYSSYFTPQPSTAEGLYTSFGNDIILFTAGSYQAQQLLWWALATTTVYLQGAQVPQQVLHSTATAGNSLVIVAITAIL